MNKLVTKQVCIFAPWKPPFDGNTWGETIYGRVIRPLVTSHPGLRWFWFLRYSESRKSGSPDFDANRLSDDFFIDDIGRLVRFRFSISIDDSTAFESHGSDLIRREGCCFSHWPEYGDLGELGGKRFCGENGLAMPNVERADLNSGLLHSVAQIVLHSLVGPDLEGRFQFEKNVDQENPNGSTFESLHHCFCNMTGVPLDVIVLRNKLTGEQLVGTQWSLKISNPQDWEITAKIPVSY